MGIIIKVIGNYEKTELSKAVKFAQVYSKTFPNNRVCIEKFLDAYGITVLSHSNQSPCPEIEIYQRGIKKRK